MEAEILEIKNSDIEIRISDLLASLLKAFKPILCLTLVLALLGGAWGVYKTIDAAKNPSVTEDDVKNAENAVKKAEDNLTNAEKSLTRLLEIEIPDAETKVVRAEQLVQRRQEYIDNSIYYAMNPFHRGVSRVTLFVDTDTEVNPNSPWMSVNPQSSIVIAYTRIYPFDSDILDNIRSIMKTDADLQYINELVSVSNVSNQFVEIRVYHDDAEVARQVTDYLLDTLQSRLSETVGEYTANVVGYFVGYEVDWAMNDSHNSNDDSLLSAERALVSAEENVQKLKEETKADRETAIEEAKQAVSDAEDDLKDVKAQFDNTSADLKNIMKNALKNAVIFLVAGAFVGCMIAFVKSFMSGKLQNTSTIVSRYGFPILGIIPPEKKRWFEKTIRKLEGDPITDPDAAGKAAVQSMTSVIAEQKAAFISSEGNSLIDRFLPYSQNLIPVCGDVLKDADALKAASEFDAFVLVEERGKSRIDQIDNEIRRVDSLGKKIKGIIVF